ncbi:hypothetical protein V6N13_108728 [Hibiscus sabdariffa]
MEAYGIGTDNLSSVENQKRATESEVSNVQVGTGSDDTYGPWMLGSRRRGNGYGKRVVPNVKSKSNLVNASIKTRFSILEHETREVIQVNGGGKLVDDANVVNDVVKVSNDVVGGSANNVVVVVDGMNGCTDGVVPTGGEGDSCW